MNIKHILVPLVFLACIISSYASAKKLFAKSSPRPSFEEFLKQMSAPNNPQQRDPKELNQQKTVKKKKIKLVKNALEQERAIERFFDSQIPPLAKSLSDIVKGQPAAETIKKKVEKRIARIKQSESSRSSRASSYRSSYGGSSYRPSSYNSPYNSYRPSSYRSPSYGSSSPYSSPYSGFSRSSYSNPYSYSPYSGYSSNGGSSSYSPRRSSYNSWDDDSSETTSSNNNESSTPARYYSRDNNLEKETEEKKKNKTFIQNIRTKFVQKLQEINHDAIKNPMQTTTKIIAFAEGIKKELELLKTTQAQLSEKDQADIQKAPANLSIYTTFTPYLFNAYPAFLAKKELGTEGFQLIFDELNRVMSKEILEGKATEFITNFAKQQHINIIKAARTKDLQKLNEIMMLLDGVKSSFPITTQNINLLDTPIKRANELSKKLTPIPTPQPSKEATEEPDKKENTKNDI